MTMKQFFLAVSTAMIVSACSSSSSSKDENAAEKISTADTEVTDNNVSNDVKNSFKQWNADNPKRPDIDWLKIDVDTGVPSQKAYKEYIVNNYGKNHSRTAVVRMYDSCPLLPDETPVNDSDNSLMELQTAHYTVYSIWRGPVVAKDNNSGLWFVVWDEDYNYNTKYITSEGDGLIKMEYIDTPDIDDNTNVIHYNLDTHRYYFQKEKYSGLSWPY